MTQGDSMDYADVGAGLRARRERAALSIRDLAERAGIHRDTLTSIESGNGHQIRKVRAVELALHKIEVERGIVTSVEADEPQPDRFIEFALKFPDGIEMTFRGDIADADTLRGVVLSIARELSPPPAS